MSGIKGPCLNLALDYFDHPKTKRLVSLLGRGAEVLPLRLWCFCGRHLAESGKLSGYSEAEIEGLMDWRGQKGRAIKALVQVGFLDRLSDGWQVHDWPEHEGHIFASHLKAQKAAKARWGRIRAPTDAPSTAPSNAQASVEQCPVPYRTVPTPRVPYAGNGTDAPPPICEKCGKPYGGSLKEHMACMGL